MATNTSIDGWAYLYHGKVAYHDWNSTNFGYRAFLGSDPVAANPGFVQLDLAAGQLVPITFLCINGFGALECNLHIATPAGFTFETTSFFIKDCFDSTFS